MPIPTDVVAEKTESSENNEEARNANLRRYLGVAKNPYTGVLHYVRYPVYYPIYG